MVMFGQICNWFGILLIFEKKLMTKIGLISDTHSHFDDAMREFLQPVSQIWHAGDVGSAALLEDFQAFKPTIAVYGNIDGYEVRLMVPAVQVFQVEQVKIVMMHIGGYPGRYEPKARQLLMTERPQIFVCGHSHILKVMYDKQFNCLHMNPGAAGVSGFNPKRTMLRFDIDGTQITNLEVWEKDKNRRIANYGDMM